MPALAHEYGERAKVRKNGRAVPDARGPRDATEAVFQGGKPARGTNRRSNEVGRQSSALPRKIMRQLGIALRARALDARPVLSTRRGATNSKTEGVSHGDPAWGGISLLGETRRERRTLLADEPRVHLAVPMSAL